MGENNSTNRALPLFITLFLASLALNLFLFFKYAKNGAEIQQKNAELEIAYKAAGLRADSLQNELNFTIQQLQDKINENLAQEDLKADLRKKLNAQKVALMAEKRKLSKLIASGGGEGDSKALAKAKTEIAQLKKEKEEYIAMVEEAQTSYVQAKQKAEAFSEENESLLEMAETLSTKLSVASTLRIAGLSITPIKEKKGKQEPEDKASRVDRLKINFEVQASDLTEPEDKEIVIRIASPSGVILTKDNNRLQDKDELASIRETITYDGTEKGVTYYFDQEADYEKGVYKVEVLNNDKLLDRKAFSLR